MADQIWAASLGSFCLAFLNVATPLQPLQSVQT